MLSDFPPLLGIFDGIHGRSVEGAFGILDDSDGGEVDAGFGGLPCEEGRFLLVDLDIGLFNFLHVGLGLFADVAHVVHATILPRIIVGVLSILLFFLYILYFDAGEGPNAVRMVSRMQGVRFRSICVFLVELSTVVLVYLFHAESDAVGEEFKHFYPNKKALFDYFGDVICGLFPDLTGVDYCWQSVLDVEDVDEATHFVYFLNLSLVYFTHLQNLYLRSFLLLVISFLLPISFMVSMPFLFRRSVLSPVSFL